MAAVASAPRWRIPTLRLRQWLRAYWWLLLLGYVAWALFGISSRFATHTCDQRLAAHTAAALQAASLVVPGGTRYVMQPPTKASDVFAGPLVGGFGGYACGTGLQGLASFDGNWRGILVPEPAVKDGYPFRQLRRQVRDYYVARLAVPGAETRANEDDICALSLGSVRYPDRSRRDVQQVVNIAVFGDEGRQRFVVLIDLTGNAVGLSRLGAPWPP